MIYELLFPLSKKFGWAGALNVLRYVPFRAILATITAMVLCFLLAPWFIRELQKKQIGQVVRSDGPETHQIKAGTPTMGGALILLGVLLPTVMWADVRNAFVIATAFVTAGYGAIGYIDDRLKIQRKSSRGLPGRYKLLGQIAIGSAAVGYSFLDVSALPPSWIEIRTRLSVPFLAFAKHPIELPLWVYVVFAVFVVVATSNAVNLTDGLDGLAIGPVMINAATYTILAYVAGLVLFGRSMAAYLGIPGTLEMGELAVYGASVVGAGVGFLWYNTYPAQVFMGDVGSLSLGGAIGTVAVLVKQEILLVFIGGVFVIEALSVILQVGSYKLRGKRIFRMAPLHHHFEAMGWQESKIIARFWIAGLVLAVFSLATLKLR